MMVLEKSFRISLSGNKTTNLNLCLYKKFFKSEST